MTQLHAKGSKWYIHVSHPKTTMRKTLIAGPLFRSYPPPTIKHSRLHTLLRAFHCYATGTFFCALGSFPFPCESFYLVLFSWSANILENEKTCSRKTASERRFPGKSLKWMEIAQWYEQNFRNILFAIVPVASFLSAKFFLVNAKYIFFT